ncbi:MAG TPA: exodeoxyribonuclease III [Oculatellaceae cyanobacterium]|jgi:exodeoxyribonuclease-3
MKIATWNVNSIRTRLDHVVQWLQDNPVDALCLQETKVVDEKFPRTPLEELGYHVYTSGQKSYNGVAIISRPPLTNVSTGFAPVLGENIVGDLDEQKRVITGVVDGIRIVNLYVPNGAAVGSDKYEYKLRWLKVLREYLQMLITSQTLEIAGEEAQTEGIGICICGDFNIAPEDKDIHDPAAYKGRIMASELERQALSAIKELGFADAFRKFNQETGNYTWWDYRTGAFRHNRGWRIDHHYLTPDLYEKSISCTIDVAPRKLTQPSDHTPVVVSLSK